MVTIADREYELTWGSDVNRDGMFLEVYPAESGANGVVAEIFYSDATGEFSISCFEEAVPLKLIEFLISEGRKRLPPSKDKQ